MSTEPRTDTASQAVLAQLETALTYWSERELRDTDLGRYEKAAEAGGAVLVVIRALNAEETNPESKPFQRPHYQPVDGCRWCLS